ncbi:MAG: glycoside hydrolase family 127 protein [Planctomycetes bacterium]|nr:glycoside hydrolase family 127 protein [Planctomycetota bacterium]
MTGAILLAAVAAGAVPSVGDWPPSNAVCRPIPLGDVKLRGFLGAHVDANNRRSIPAGLASPIPKAFEARARGADPAAICRRLATDSDFFKWLEGASYATAYDPSLGELRASVCRYAGIVRDLQEPGGFLGTRLSPAAPFDERVAHDLYVAGHFFEAAVADFKATGERRLLDAAVRLAEFYRRALAEGHPYFKIVGTREHPEVEIALVRLSRATGDRRLLAFAAEIARLYRVGPTLAETHAGGGRLHAVRLCYLLAGLAELAIETGDQSFRRHLIPLWDEIVTTRMYVTGGIGASERIPDRPYDLPQTLAGNPNRDIAETCASVALMMFGWRLHALTGESRFFDTIETILYNHYLGALSADHLGNFYYNPLRRVGDLAGKTDHGGDPVRRTRLPAIHSTACCMPNAWRFFAQLPEYILSARGDALLVNLYAELTARHRLRDGTAVDVEVSTRYPADGRVRIRVSPDAPSRFPLGLRIPAWCDAARVSVAGGPIEPARAGGYHMIDRAWKAGDEVLLDLPMHPVAIEARSEVEANRGQVAFRRGPLVYCLERQDAPGLDLERIEVVLDRDNPSHSIEAIFDADLDLHVLRVRAREQGAAGESREVQLIPFYDRANREPETRWITWIPRA